MTRSSRDEWASSASIPPLWMRTLFEKEGWFTPRTCNIKKYEQSRAPFIIDRSRFSSSVQDPWMDDSKWDWYDGNLHLTIAARSRGFEANWRTEQRDHADRSCLPRAQTRANVHARTHAHTRARARAEFSIERETSTLARPARARSRETLERSKTIYCTERRLNVTRIKYDAN